LLDVNTHSFEGIYTIALKETPEPESPEKCCQAKGSSYSLKKLW